MCFMPKVITQTFYWSIYSAHCVVIVLFVFQSNIKMSTKLVFYEFGEPSAVLSRESLDIPEPKDKEVLIEMLAAPVNPVDINIVQGKYSFKPTLPAVPGSEGVGRVLKVGAQVSEFSEGDHVVTWLFAGTWRTHLVLDKDVIIKVPKELGIVAAATIVVNPCCVYRMLRDFVKVQRGDTVIQNGGNSACGQIVIQMCRLYGINTVSVVRNRPEIESLKKVLTDLGANYVLTEDEVKNTAIFKNGTLPKPKLALNCVGGQSATDIIKHLEYGGTMVTYGAMSLQPLTVPNTFLLFKDYRLRGFNLGQWFPEDGKLNQKEQMFKEVIEMLLNGHLKEPPHVIIPLDNYREALENTLSGKGMIGKKYILEIKAHKL